MNKKRKPPYPERPAKSDYKHELHDLQVELVKFQRHLIDKGERILVLFEGRDTAGKDGTIKRVIQHLSPRDTRVVALGVPSDRERSSWYFQRYVPHLPAAGEMVLFNRSWYNRAGVERVMGFCSDAEYEAFMEAVPTFENLLVRSGIQMFKYYLDISRGEQKKRLKAREVDPLKRWKTSPIDAQAQKRWGDYTQARNEMLVRTHTPVAPWTVVRADCKRLARLNVIRDMLIHLEYPGKNSDVILPDSSVIFPFSNTAIEDKWLAP